MSEFSYARSAGSDVISQYIEHKRNISIIGNFDKSPEKLIAYQTSVIQNEIRYANVGVQNMLGEICNSVDYGFQMLSSHLKETNYRLGEINDSLNSMYSMLDEKLEMLVYAQRETNEILSDLRRISVIPDRQKDSYAYLEKAIIFFNAAIEEGFYSDLFHKAQLNLNTALELDNDNLITHFYLGQIVLNSIDYLDTKDAKQNLENAEKNFVYSARLAKILAVSNSATNQSVLYNHYQFGNKITNKEALYFEAANALLAASKAAYLQLKFETAIDYCKQAINLTPNWTEPLCRLAKYYAANGNCNEAAKSMETAIEIDRFQVFKVIQDADLYSKREINEMINNISQRAIREAKNEYTRCINIALENTSQKMTLNAIKALLDIGDFLSAKKAMDIIKTPTPRKIMHYYIKNEKPEEMTTSYYDTNNDLYGFLKKEADTFENKKQVSEVVKNNIKSNYNRNLYGIAMGAGLLFGSIGFICGIFTSWDTAIDYGIKSFLVAGVIAWCLKALNS